jgi:hypothetical protein
VTYDFTQLSPLDFEHLVRDILNDAWHWHLESFAPGPDQGVDLRATLADGKRVIVQCKHTPHASKRAVVRLAAKEASRADTAAMDRYLFATSAELSAAALDSVAEALASLPVAPDGVLGRSRLNQMLSRDIERAHFKLWLTSSAVLDRVLHAAVFARTDALIDEMRRAVPRWVDVPVYHRALKALVDERVAVLTGPPGVGKSTVAQMLLLTAANDDWQIVPIAGDLTDAWAMLRGEERQVFFYDDFLGSVSFAQTRGEDTNDIVKFVRAVRTRSGDTKRVVLTSRTQVLAEAREMGNEDVDRLPLLNAECVVELAELTRMSRAQMLFNHLYFGLADEERAALAFDPRLLRAVDHRNFSPRTVDLVVGRNATAPALLDDLEATLDHPTDLWRASFAVLPPLARCTLETLATVRAVDATESFLRHHVGPSDHAQWHASLRQLEGTWIRISGSGASARISFANPSCQDYVHAQLDTPAGASAAILRARSVSQLAVLGMLAGDVRDVPGGLQFHATRPHLHAAMVDAMNDLPAAIARCVTADLATVRAAEHACPTPERHTSSLTITRRSALSPRTDVIRDVLRLAVTYELDITRFPDALAAFAEISAFITSRAMLIPRDGLSACLRWVAGLKQGPAVDQWHAPAQNIVICLADEASTLEDLKRIADLPVSVRSDIDLSHLHDVIASTEAELFADADDDSGAQDAIEMLARVADAFGCYVDIDDLQQRADALPAWQPSGQHITALHSAMTDAADDADGDDRLRSLFARLNIDSDEHAADA